MCHYSLLLCLTFSGIFLKYAAGSSKWCYSGCDHSPSHWKDLPDSFCGETRQSPINIVTSNVLKYYDLPEFHIVNLTSGHVIESVANNGHTVKYTLKENAVEVSGGGLSDIYSALQFHFHWGDTGDHPGSEHMINLHRYPMEMHIVSKKKNLAVEEAKNDPEGFAVLGFFIEADKENENQPESWKNLTSYLSDETNTTKITVTHKISLDDLIGSVNRTMFYRYMGSLTTPDCNEAVVWTIFHQPIKISKNLIEMFPKKTALTNVYRPTQALNMRTVFVSRTTPLSTSHWCYDDHCEYTPSYWHYFSEYCGDLRQSPVNIDTHSLVTDEHLDALTFTKFNDKQSIKSIINTGHTVKCVLKEGLEVSGGGLGYVYSILQFHFHWGTESNTSEGSEHTVDSKRYPMEMHIVSKRKDLSLEEAKNTPNGLAVLGFFIEPLSTKSERSGSSSDNHETNPTSSPSSPASNTEAWRKLTNYLSNVKQTSIEVEVTEEISIDDLLGGVSRTVYYRYNGSLTTPTCNEAVVWTVFKESVKVDEKYMKMFPAQTGYGNVFRDVQPLYGRVIYSTASATEPHGAASAPAPCILFLLLACLCIFPFTVHL